MTTEINVPSAGPKATPLEELEVEQQALFVHPPPIEIQRQASSSMDEQDKLMMTEYDDSNVIVIDLTEERNASARSQVGGLINTDHPAEPKLGFVEERPTEPSEEDEEGSSAAESQDGQVIVNCAPVEAGDNEDDDEDICQIETLLYRQPVPRENSLPPVVPYKTVKTFTRSATLDHDQDRPTTTTTGGEKNIEENGNHIAEKVPLGVDRKAAQQRKLLQRAKTINGTEDLLTNDGSHHNDKFQSGPRQGKEDDDQLPRRHRSHKHTRSSKKSSSNHRTTDSSGNVTTASSVNSADTVLLRERRSASCRRSMDQKERCATAIANFTAHSHTLMSMSMIGNSLGGMYGDDAYERRRKARSNDFLDRIDISVVSTRSAATMSKSHKKRVPAKMNRIEKGLFLGNMEAATDVILLESHAITHIITVDSVPLPRKITSLLPRIAMIHLQVTDLPDEDLLSHFTEANAFIEEGLSKDGAVLVHCFRGRSRSATVVAAYLMQKHGYAAERALAKVRAKRDCIQPHQSFLAQLKLYENMDFTLDPSNIQFKMFKLYCASERMRKAKILFRDSLEQVIDEDPAGGLPGSAASAFAAAAKSRYPMIYKCKKCRRTLATAFNLLPHLSGESPLWSSAKFSLPSEDVLEGASDSGLNLCSASVYVNPVRWMEQEIRQNLSGRLYCPNCQARVGNYSWVIGDNCEGCGATVKPAFALDVTEIIFRTRNRFLQSNTREPVVV